MKSSDVTAACGLVVLPSATVGLGGDDTFELFGVNRIDGEDVRGGGGGGGGGGISVTLVWDDP